LASRILPLALILAAGVGSAYAQPDGAAPGPPSDGAAQALGAFVRAANAFRIAASASTLEAVTDFGADAFVAKWDKEVLPRFQDFDLGWRDLFSNAVMFAGGVTPDSAVIAFYSPWHDALALTLWQGKPSERLVHDVLVLTGATWRGEEPKDPALPAWLTEKGGVIQCLGRVYKRTSEAFDRRFPLWRKAPFPPDDLPLTSEAKINEFATVKTRMAQRLLMFQRFMVNPDNDAQAAALLAAANRAATAIAEETPQGLTRMLGAAQKRDVIDLIWQLPKPARAELVPMAFLVQGDKSAVALVNAKLPQWFVLLHARLKDGKATLTEVELAKFDALSKLDL